MAASENNITDTIRVTVRRMFYTADRDQLSVNSVRSKVEAELGLEDGFLKSQLWKPKSKTIIKDETILLIELEEAGDPPASIPSTPVKILNSTTKKSKTEPVKRGTKRSSGADRGQERKRPKKQETPLSGEEDSSLTLQGEATEESEESDFSDAPKKKKKAKKPPSKPPPKPRQKKTADHEEDADLATSAKSPPSKFDKKLKSKKPRIDDDESDVSGKEEHNPDESAVKEVEQIVESDSDMSIVLDEPLSRKGRGKPAAKGQSAASTSKPSKESKTVKPPSNLSPDEAEIKTLQAQLSKCGVRKIWGFILKEYGSDTKAKIRHLKGMLRDVGMDGRFSEAKAKEIKESRELLADLEAVQEGDAKWGMGRERRSKKSGGGKKVIEQSDEEQDDNEEDDEVATRNRSLSEHSPKRAARAKMDLAFLGDEESDSE